MTDRCPYRARHWRIMPGVVGVRAPVCTDCGSPNPKPLSDEEWNEVLYWHYQAGYRRTKHVQAAINARLAAGDQIRCRTHVIDLRPGEMEAHHRCSLYWRSA